MEEFPRHIREGNEYFENNPEWKVIRVRITQPIVST